MVCLQATARRAGLRRRGGKGHDARDSEERAGAPLLGLGLRAKHRADGLVEDVLEALLGEGRALEVLDRADLLRHGQPLRVRDGGELAVAQLLHGVLVLPQVQLGAHQDDGCVGAVVAHLGVPLRPDIFKGCWVYQGEADEEDIRLWVGEWPQPVVVLLTGRIPQAEVDGLAIDHNIGRVIVEHCGYVFAREGIGGVADEEACFTDGTIADDHALYRLHSVVSV